MKRTRNNNQGFAAVESLLIVIVLLLIGFIGYFVYSQRTGTKADTTATKKAITSTKTSTQPTKQADNYVEAIQDDGSITVESAAAFSKTSDELGVLEAIHKICTNSDSYVVVNAKVFASIDDPSVYVQDGGHAFINTSCGPKASTIDEFGGSGTATYLHRNADQSWTIDAQSQSALDCSKVDGKGYPPTVLPQCSDGDTLRPPKS